MTRFCYITRSFSYRRNDVSFILQLIWANAIFVKVVAVSFNLSFEAWSALTKLKTTAEFAVLQSNQFSFMKKNIVLENRQKRCYYSS